MHPIWVPAASLGPSGEAVDRRLQLKGSYEGGVRPLQDPQQRQAIDQANSSIIRSWLNSQEWDGILLGNLDLLGPEFCQSFWKPNASCSITLVLYTRPFHPCMCRKMNRYRLVGASEAVRSALVSAGLPASTANVVYPGVRSELFGVERVGMPSPWLPMAAGNDH